MGIKLNWCYLFFTTIFTSFHSSITAKAEGRLILSPMPDLVDSTLIYYNASDKSSVLKWATIIDGFLEEYQNDSDRENRMNCSFTDGPVTDNKVCDVPLDNFNPCVHTNQYNFVRSSPCVFLKLGNILNWKPEIYNDTKDLPEDMPRDLMEHIKMVSGKPEANAVWVSCEGENPADMENIGPVQYIPRRGFPAYYYPFTNKEGYLSPLVAVLFERPMTGVLINIECKAWAKNIHERYERRGSVHFELMVDTN